MSPRWAQEFSGRSSCLYNVANNALSARGEVPADASGDPGRGVLDGISGQVRIAGGRVDLVVAKQFADHRERFAERQGPAGKGVPRNTREWADSQVQCSVLCSIKVMINAVADSSGGGLHCVSGEVCVARGRLHLRVTEQLPDHRQPFAQRQGP